MKWTEHYKVIISSSSMIFDFQTSKKSWRLFFRLWFWFYFSLAVTLKTISRTPNAISKMPNATGRGTRPSPMDSTFTAERTCRKSTVKNRIIECRSSMPTIIQKVNKHESRAEMGNRPHYWTPAWVSPRSAPSKFWPFRPAPDKGRIEVIIISSTPTSCVNFDLLNSLSFNKTQKQHQASACAKIFPPLISYALIVTAENSEFRLSYFQE